MAIEKDEELIPTRQSLLERLRLWDEPSWKDFFDTYWKLIYRTARMAGLSASESEEVVQETVVAVARLIPNFKYKPAEQGGSFKRWLLNQTKWRIGDHFRRGQRERHLVPLDRRSRNQSEEFSDLPDPVSTQLDRQWDEEWARNLVNAAVEHVKARVDPKHYQIFFLKNLKNWSAIKVAQHLKVGLPMVYTVSHRISKLFRSRLKELRENES